jgi:hypothetical protein
MATEERPSMPTIDPVPETPPNWLERTCFIIAGVVADGAGGYAALERSNQLGAAVLIVVGAVFLVVGIQGTRLMRFTSGSAVVELERKQRRIAYAIEKAQDEGNLEKASGIAEGAAIASPALRPGNVGIQYELKVSAAIIEMGYHVMTASLDLGFDLVISDESRSHIIFADLKRLTRPVPKQAIDRLLPRIPPGRTPALLITYTELSNAARELISSLGRVEVVRWRDEHDNDRLAEMLRNMFASISNGPNTAADDQSL